MSDIEKESVLVTGANGFVGSRLCRRLLADGYHVIAGIREGCNQELIHGLDLEFRYGDITQPKLLTAMVKDVNYIIQNAGVVKAKNPDLFFAVNHFGTKNLIEACLRNSKLKKFLLISSFAAIGPSEPNKPMSEDVKPAPLTAYGRSKLAGEETVLSYKDKLNVTILRPAGVYGPGDKEMLAFYQIVNLWIKPYLGNLSRRMQLIHVDDLCLGVSKTLKAKTESGSIYFLAESESYDVREMVHYLQAAVGRRGIPLYIPGALLKVIAAISENVMRAIGKPPMFTVEKANEILSSWEVSTIKAQNELGFKSEIPFPEGAMKTAEWYFEEGWL